MTDRRRRAALRRRPLPLLLPLPLPLAADGGPVLLRERKGGGDTEASGTGAGTGTDPSGTDTNPSSSGTGTNPSGSGSGSGSGDDNPFAPPPEGRPDQPWQPRRPTGETPNDPDNSGSGGSGWGSRWSDRQPPSRGSGGFGGPGGTGGTGRGQNGPDGAEGGPGTNLRWDPTDPAQRRARYALLAGMWAFFFALFTQREISLLLGALALYWGISSLRNKQPKPDATAALTGPPAAPATPPVSTRPQTTAAVSGLVTAALALAIVATTFTVQLVYRDYYTCVADSLTKSAQVACNDELPKSLIPVFGVKE
ncbi:hypothetical protein ACH4SP_23410 [Streptomyces sp. NPDC021093]|uniref:hypothetical protein n=1 Tax=Streptomyces sp. NPDC021093 TaxID=3365112 RepID=UPI0037B19B90